MKKVILVLILIILLLLAWVSIIQKEEVDVNKISNVTQGNFIDYDKIVIFHKI